MTKDRIVTLAKRLAANARHGDGKECLVDRNELNELRKALQSLAMVENASRDYVPLAMR